MRWIKTVEVPVVNYEALPIEMQFIIGLVLFAVIIIVILLTPYPPRP